jgi:ActR/RegA family two-component response regulator
MQGINIALYAFTLREEWRFRKTPALGVKKPVHKLENAMQSIGAQDAHNLVLNSSVASESAQFKILVVGGDHFFTGFVDKFFETEGHRVIKAISADEAVAKTTEFQPDLILLDNEVEGAIGRDLLGDLLTQQFSAGILVFAKNPKISEAAEAVRRGAIDYQQGPLDIQRLKEIIEFQKAIF